jgi:hypothetical protein
MATPFPVLELGPLQGLLGKWSGKGKDVAFLPGGTKVESDFVEETIVSVAPVMRITSTLFIHAASYESRLHHAVTGEALHQEFGYWGWIPQSGRIVRVVALGRAIGVVASGVQTSTPGAVPLTLNVAARLAMSPPAIASADLGMPIPSMEEFVCDVSISGNIFSYDQVTRVRFGVGTPLLDHTDTATLMRQP